jgi:hypothetical protein
VAYLATTGVRITPVHRGLFEMKCPGAPPCSFAEENTPLAVENRRTTIWHCGPRCLRNHPNPVFSAIKELTTQSIMARNNSVQLWLTVVRPEPASGAISHHQQVASFDNAKGGNFFKRVSFDNAR